MMQIILNNLPALQVVLPLVAAPICFLLPRNSSYAWGLAFIVAIFTFIISILLFNQTDGGNITSYAMGGWEPPWGIEYRIDGLGAFILLIVSTAGVFALAFAKKSVEKEISSQPLFYCAFLLCLAGLLGIVITGDAFNLFVFLEISSLATYILIAFGSNRRALKAAFQYLIIGTIGATMLLIGIGFLYMMTGTLNMADLAERIPNIEHTNVIRVAFAFIIIGLCIKLALFPLHIWLPNSYSYAPSVVTIFLAASSTKVALYALLRFIFTVFGVEFSFTEMPLQAILISLSILAVLFGSALAIFQKNIKHVLAYSSISQIGYMVMGLALVSIAGLSAGILHMFNHAIIKGGLFLTLGCIYYQRGGIKIEDFKGLGKIMPWTMAAFVIGGLGLIGMPLTAGFISKWYLILAAFEQGVIGFVLIAVILLGSLLAVAYIWRIVEVAYFQKPPASKISEAPILLLIPTWIVTLSGIYFGIDTSFSTNAAEMSASAIWGDSQ